MHPCSCLSGDLGSRPVRLSKREVQYLAHAIVMAACVQAPSLLWLLGFVVLIPGRACGLELRL